MQFNETMNGSTRKRKVSETNLEVINFIWMNLTYYWYLDSLILWYFVYAPAAVMQIINHIKINLTRYPCTTSWVKSVKLILMSFQSTLVMYEGSNPRPSHRSQVLKPLSYGTSSPMYLVLGRLVLQNTRLSFNWSCGWVDKFVDGGGGGETSGLFLIWQGQCER